MNIVNVGYHSTNYYAVEINNGKLLIDCGWPGTYPQFTAEMKRKGVGPNEIQYILVTHFHPDHAGLVQEFKDRGSKLIVMETQVGSIAPLNDLVRKKFYPYTELQEDDNFNLKFIDSREFLASLGLAGEIISTPGHSNDSVTLILDEGFAFTGDLRSRFLVPDDDKVTHDSWAKIYQHQIRKIYPAHGS